MNLQQPRLKLPSNLSSYYDLVLTSIDRQQHGEQHTPSPGKGNRHNDSLWGLMTTTYSSPFSRSCNGGISYWRRKWRMDRTCRGCGRFQWAKVMHIPLLGNWKEGKEFGYRCIAHIAYLSPRWRSFFEYFQISLPPYGWLQNRSMVYNCTSTVLWLRLSKLR